MVCVRSRTDNRSGYLVGTGMMRVMADDRRSTPEGGGAHEHAPTSRPWWRQLWGVPPVTEAGQDIMYRRFDRPMSIGVEISLVLGLVMMGVIALSQRYWALGVLLLVAGVATGCLVAWRWNYAHPRDRPRDRT